MHIYSHIWALWIPTTVIKNAYLNTTYLVSLGESWILIWSERNRAAWVFKPIRRRARLWTLYGALWLAERRVNLSRYVRRAGRRAGLAATVYLRYFPAQLDDHDVESRLSCFSSGFCRLFDDGRRLSRCRSERRTSEKRPELRCCSAQQSLQRHVPQPSGRSGEGPDSGRWTSTKLLMKYNYIIQV